MTARKRGVTGLCGVLLVDKPAGMTSHDVVSAVRRATGEGRVGHAGTLDPMATGLLVMLVGPATRLEPYISAAEKSYAATIAFGAATDTDDTEGQVVAELAVPSEVCDSAHAQEVLEGFLGEAMQQPPVYSAIKVGGKTAHRAARMGHEIELAPRPIRVDRARLVAIECSPPSWTVDFTVSKGTYIRALARDIGQRAGTVAHLSGLRRTTVGPLDVSDARALEDVVSAAQQGLLDSLWVDPVHALGFPAAEVDPVLAEDGRPIPVDRMSSTTLAAIDGESLVSVVAQPHGSLLGLYSRRGDRLVPRVVFPTGVTRGVQ